MSNSSKQTVKVTKEDVDKAAKKIKDEKLLEVEMDEESQKYFKEALDLAKKPIEFKDEDFKLAPQELDIRELSDKNYRQLMFRLEGQKVAHLRNISQTLVDVLRSNYLILTKLGVENINEEMNNMMVKMATQLNGVIKETRKPKQLKVDKA